MLDRDWSLSGKNGRSGLVAMVYVVATRGKLLKGTSREQAFLQKRPVAIKHFCERDQSRSQITTSNYKLIIDHLLEWRIIRGFFIVTERQAQSCCLLFTGTNIIIRLIERPGDSRTVNSCDNDNCSSVETRFWRLAKWLTCDWPANMPCVLNKYTTCKYVQHSKYLKWSSPLQFPLSGWLAGTETTLWWHRRI